MQINFLIAFSNTCFPFKGIIPLRGFVAVLWVKFDMILNSLSTRALSLVRSIDIQLD